MPIYEYRCDMCQNIFEVLTTAGSKHEKALCGKCGSDKVSKIISAGSFIRSSGKSLPCAGSSAGSPSCGKRGFS